MTKTRISLGLAVLLPVSAVSHGGGCVHNPGEAGTFEAVLMAGYGGFKVSRSTTACRWDFPCPAAMDDADAVWKALSEIGRFDASRGAESGSAQIVHPVHS